MRTLEPHTDLLNQKLPLSLRVPGDSYTQDGLRSAAPDLETTSELISGVTWRACALHVRIWAPAGLKGHEEGHGEASGPT